MELQLRGGFSIGGEANGLSLHFLFLLYAIPRKSQALHRKFTELTGRPRRNAPVSVSFRRKVCYNKPAALPADIVRKGGEGSDPYSHDFGVGHSKCDLPLHLQVA